MEPPEEGSQLANQLGRRFFMEPAETLKTKITLTKKKTRSSIMVGVAHTTVKTCQARRDSSRARVEQTRKPDRSPPTTQMSRRQSS
jgi:hypothetical protein